MPDDVTNQEIVAKNLHYIRERELKLMRLRALEVEELLPPELPEPYGMRELSRVWRGITRAEDYDAETKALLCRHIFNVYRSRGVDMAELMLRERGKVDDWLAGINGTPPTVVYVGNPYADEAKRRLFGDSQARERVCRSFSELCDDISTGVGDGCMIPIENTSDGKLMSFYSVIDRFELKILRACDIDNSDGSQATRYALLSRRACRPSDEGEHYLEFSFTLSGQNELYGLLRVAEQMSLQPSRFDSVPQRYDEAASTLYPVLRGRGDDLLCFLLYLKLELHGHTFIGLYDHV